jgi:hypothetical protein
MTHTAVCVSSLLTENVRDELGTYKSTFLFLREAEVAVQAKRKFFKHMGQARVNRAKKCKSQTVALL